MATDWAHVVFFFFSKKAISLPASSRNSRVLASRLPEDKDGFNTFNIEYSNQWISSIFDIPKSIQNKMTMWWKIAPGLNWGEMWKNEDITVHRPYPKILFGKCNLRSFNKNCSSDETIWPFIKRHMACGKDKIVEKDLHNPRIWKLHFFPAKNILAQYNNRKLYFLFGAWNMLVRLPSPLLGVRRGTCLEISKIMELKLSCHGLDRFDASCHH